MPDDRTIEQQPEQRPNSYVQWLASIWRVTIQCANGCAQGTGPTREEAIDKAVSFLEDPMGPAEDVIVEEPMGLQWAQAHFDLLCYIGSGQWRLDHQEGGKPHEEGRER